MKNLGHDVLARSARTPVLSAMSALNASAQRGQHDMRGFAGRARIETHHPAKHSALGLVATEKLACRTSHRISSQLYGWRTRTASLKAANLKLHITGRVQRSPSAGFKGVPHTWQSGGPPDEDEEVNDERGEGQRPWLPASHLLKRLPASFSGFYDEK